MRILVLEMSEEGKKITEGLFADRNDTQVRILFPNDISSIVDEKPYDIIFIPLKIDKMEGSELCREIKKVNPDSVVYAYSRHLNLYNPDTLESVGFDGFIKKPAKKETLMTAIDGAISKLQRLTTNGLKPN